MSMLNRPGKGNGTDLGEVIASTKDYEAAQKVVSKLIASEVPARDIAIVGEGVRSVERVTGKLGYAAAARSGAMNGVLIGLLLSAIMLFGTPDAPISLFLGFLLIGVALGMIMSLVTYSIVRRRRDFASMMQMVADHYEVRVQSSSLAKAREAVGPQRPSTVRPAVDLSEPPRYGERLPAPGQDDSPGRGGAPGQGAPGNGAPGPAAAPSGETTQGEVAAPTEPGAAPEATPQTGAGGGQAGTATPQTPQTASVAPSVPAGPMVIPPRPPLPGATGGAADATTDGR